MRIPIQQKISCDHPIQLCYKGSPTALEKHPDHYTAIVVGDIVGDIL
jgi:hypothetical protein